MVHPTWYNPLVIVIIFITITIIVTSSIFVMEVPKFVISIIRYIKYYWQWLRYQ